MVGLLPFLLLLAGVGVVGCAPDAPSRASAATPAQQQVELLVFSAKWCSVCRNVPPVLKRLEAEFPEVTIRELDVDDDEAGKLAAEYGADALPYYFVRVDGEVVARQRGFLPYAEARQFLRAAMNRANAAKR